MKSTEFLAVPKKYIKENNKPKQPSPPGKDPNKLLAIKIRDDYTFPPHVKAALGKLNLNNPEDTEKLKNTLVDRLKKSFQDARYINLPVQPDFDVIMNWCLDRYAKGILDYEDISGEGGDAIGAWMALRNQPPRVGRKNNRFPTDINQFRDISQIQNLIRDPWYANVLRKLADQATIEKHKRESTAITLINDERFFVIAPMNYGACYVFNNADGYQANFCTGSSSGLSWFNRYAPEGMIVSILDKTNIDQADGKWQMHSKTNQLVNADQERRYDIKWNDNKFATLFPGLMKRICQSILSNREVIYNASKENIENCPGYIAEDEVVDIQNKFPISYNSVPPETQNQDNLL